jgi:hypothetical protein
MANCNRKFVEVVNEDARGASHRRMAGGRSSYGNLFYDFLSTAFISSYADAERGTFSSSSSYFYGVSQLNFDWQYVPFVSIGSRQSGPWQ